MGRRDVGCHQLRDFLAYLQGRFLCSFSASGSFSSQGNFGEMGTEHNGVFVDRDEKNASGVQNPSSDAQVSQTSQGAKQSVKTVLLKGHVPVKVNQ